MHKSTLKIVTILLSCLSFLFLQSCGEGVSGTEVGNEKMIALYMPDGETPAIDADVRIFRSGDTTHVPVFTTKTDEDGQYAIGDNLSANEYYNIIATNDSLAAFQDSILLIGDEVDAANDTLEAAVSVSGVVAIELNHNVQTVTVHVLGTFAKTGVAEDGTFTLPALALGTYTVMCISTIDEYTPLYYQLQITENSELIEDTLRLVYTGIPVVPSLVLESDTGAGTVTVRWPQTTYFDVQDYRVYRTENGSTYWSEIPLTATTDTFYVDTIYKGNDTQKYHYKYRVTITNNSDQEGLPYGSFNIETISPIVAKSIIDTDSLLIDENGTVTLAVTPGEWFGESPTVSWDIGNKGNFNQGTGLDTTLTFPLDTLVLDLETVVKVTGVDGREVLDTFYVRGEKPLTLLESSIPDISYASYGTPFAFNGNYYMLMNGGGKRALLESFDGLNWSVKVDSICDFESQIQTVEVFNNSIVMLVYKAYYSENYAKLVIFDEVFEREDVEQFPQTYLDDYEQFHYSRIEVIGDTLMLFTAVGDWAFDTTYTLLEEAIEFKGLWNYTSASILEYKDIEYRFVTPFGPSSDPEQCYIYKEIAAHSYEQIHSFERDESDDWSRGFTPACLYSGGVLLFRSDKGFELSKKVIYSENMVDWYPIAELSEINIRGVLNINGMLHLYSSDGQIYSLK